MPSPLKDSRNSYLKSRVYKVLCSCDTSYIIKTGHSFVTRLKEHAVDIRHERVFKSALAEHSSSTKHHIHLEDALIVSKEQKFFKSKEELERMCCGFPRVSLPMTSDVIYYAIM